ncbi:MAG: hypothetical protein ABI286_02335 [Edaphobacter sp.]
MMGIQDDGSFAVNPLGPGGVGEGVNCHGIGANKATIVVNEVAAMVSKEVTGECFAALPSGPTWRKAGGAPRLRWLLGRGPEAWLRPEGVIAGSEMVSTGCLTHLNLRRPVI